MKPFIVYYIKGWWLTNNTFNEGPIDTLEEAYARFKALQKMRSIRALEINEESRHRRTVEVFERN